MTWRDRPWTVAAALWVLGCLVVGGLLAWLGLGTLLPVLDAARVGTTVVEFWAPIFVTLPLALAAIALATLEFMPTPTRPRGKRKRAPSRGVDATTLVFYGFLGCVLLTVIAIPVGRVALSSVMAARDYRTCPHPSYRHSPIRWVRTGVPCP